jgi:tRNA(Ile)-lysidine synthase
MRQARSGDADGMRGLAGIAPATLFEGKVWFVRQLLPLRREALRSYLRRRRVGWIDDPTNADGRHERPRLRKRLAEADGEAALVAALATAAEAAEHREALGRAAAALISVHAEQAAPGLVRLTPEFFGAADRDAAIYALRILLATAGGTEQLPDAARAAALFARLAAATPGRTALSRALVDQRKNGVFLLREARGFPNADAIREGAIWDGRFRIQAPPTVMAEQPQPPARQRPQEPAPESLVRLAGAAEPTSVNGRPATPVVAPWARYLPSFDLAPARAVAALIGASDIPPPPFPGHIEGKA